MKLVNFIKDDNGKESISRVLIFMLVINYIGLTWFFAAVKSIAFDIPLQVGALIAVLYGVNKTSKKENTAEEGK